MDRISPRPLALVALVALVGGAGPTRADLLGQGDEGIPVRIQTLPVLVPGPRAPDPQFTWVPGFRRERDTLPSASVPDEGAASGFSGGPSYAAAMLVTLLQRNTVRAGSKSGPGLDLADPGSQRLLFRRLMEDRGGERLALPGDPRDLDPYLGRAMATRYLEAGSEPIHIRAAGDLPAWVVHAGSWAQLTRMGTACLGLMQDTLALGQVVPVFVSGPGGGRGFVAYGLNLRSGHYAEIYACDPVGGRASIRILVHFKSGAVEVTDDGYQRIPGSEAWSVLTMTDPSGPTGARIRAQALATLGSAAAPSVP